MRIANGRGADAGFAACESREEQGIAGGVSMDTRENMGDEARGICVREIAAVTSGASRVVHF